MLKRLVTSLILLIIATPSLAQPKFKAGQAYQAVTPSVATAARLQVPSNKVSVVEFYNYGCPWCYRLEAKLQKWLKNKPDYVTFERIPVVFESGWDTYAKAYYAAKALGKLDTLTPALFRAIHVEKRGLTSQSSMETFFEKQGISKEKVEDIFNYSPSLNLLVERGKRLTMAYKVFHIPGFIIDGKYMTNPSLAGGDNKKLLQVVDFLINKSKQERHIDNKA
jgi:thiol:disulfide interchange protein DsbA